MRKGHEISHKLKRDLRKVKRDKENATQVRLNTKQATGSAVCQVRPHEITSLDNVLSQERSGYTLLDHVRSDKAPLDQTSYDVVP